MQNGSCQAPDTELSALTKELLKFPGGNAPCTSFLPDREVIIKTLQIIRNLLFPGYFDKQSAKNTHMEYYLGTLLYEAQDKLRTQICRALMYQHNPGQCDESTYAEAGEITDKFLAKLPALREILYTDVEASMDGDPAARSHDEIIFAYPGIYAISVYRVAHELFLLGVPLIPRIMTEHAHSITGIDIHPGAQIGSSFFIDHGTGVVIGETTVIGNHVKIYQGVTLGALSTRGGQSLRGVKRHPTLEDEVTVYSSTSILGGETVIGKGVIIGSNVFLTKSVAPGTRVSITPPDLKFKEMKEPTAL